MRPTITAGLLLAGAAGCRAAAAAAPTLGADARRAIADTVQEVSERMLQTMAGRNPDSVLAFYGKRTAFIGDGAIGDWEAIVANVRPRYATYAKVDCRWGPGFRVDVLGAEAAVVTATLGCEKTDTGGKVTREDLARTEVLAIEDGRWRIVAVHESAQPGPRKKSAASQ